MHNSSNEIIAQIASELKGKSPKLTVKKTFRWVQLNLKYDTLDALNPVSTYLPEKTISRGAGNCVAISGVFMALLRANNIDCRFHLLHISPTKTSLSLKIILMNRTDFPHGYVDVKIEDQWVPMLPITGLQFKSDVGHTILELKGKDGVPKVVLIEDLGVFAEIPAERIEKLGSKLHPHLHGKGAFIRKILAKALTTQRD